MGAVTFANQVLNFIDGLCGFKLGLLRSLKSAAAVCGSEYEVMKDPNAQSSIAWLSDRQLDLVVSYSAPCVFRTQLLDLPKFGCINLHCSLLPKYTGLLPSFWTLYEKTTTLGATVHKMDSQIDNGAILGQVVVPGRMTPPCLK